MRTLFAFVVAVGAARGSEPPAAWSDDPPPAWSDPKPHAAPERFTDVNGVVYEVLPDGFCRRVSGPTAAPGVAAPPTFQRAGGVHAGHNCPSCGRGQYVVAGWNRDGTHTHVCAGCSTSWRH